MLLSIPAVSLPATMSRRFRAGRHTKMLLLTVAGLLLAACENNTTRQCPAFNHPLASEWQPRGLGETYVYSDADGNASSYTVDSIVNNEPFEESGRGTERDVTCTLTSEQVLRSEATDEVFRFTFTQFDTANAPPAAQNLELDIVQEQPAGTQVSQRYFFTPSNPQIENIDNFVRVRTFVESLEIAGTQYTNLIDFSYLVNEETEISFANLFDSDLPTVLSRVLLAEGVGLLQFERADGTVNTLQ